MCISETNLEQVKHKVGVFNGFWSEVDCNNNINCLFIYGDNDCGLGMKGQAVIRLCKNSIGLPTKKYPRNNISSFYTDDEYVENCIKINLAISKIVEVSNYYDYIILPSGGFGTGLSQLQKYAPKTLLFLNSQIEKYFGVLY